MPTEIHSCKSYIHVKNNHSITTTPPSLRFVMQMTLAKRPKTQYLDRQLTKGSFLKRATNLARETFFQEKKNDLKGREPKQQ